MFKIGNLTKNLQNLIKFLKKVIKIHFYKMLFLHLNVVRYKCNFIAYILHD